MAKNCASGSSEKEDSNWLVVISSRKWMGGGCGVNGRAANLALIPSFGENIYIGLFDLH